MASFGGRSRGSPFPEDPQSSARKGCEVCVPGGNRLRGGCVTAQPHWDKLLLCHRLPILISPHKEKSDAFSGSLGRGTHMTVASHPIGSHASQHHKSSLRHTENCHPSTCKVQFLSCLVPNSRQLKCPWSHSRAPHSVCRECNCSPCGKAAPVPVGLVQLRVCEDVSVIHNYLLCSCWISQTCVFQNAPAIAF